MRTYLAVIMLLIHGCIITLLTSEDSRYRVRGINAAMELADVFVERAETMSLIYALRAETDGMDGYLFRLKILNRAMDLFDPEYDRNPPPEDIRGIEPPLDIIDGQEQGHFSGTAPSAFRDPGRRALYEKMLAENEALTMGHQAQYQLRSDMKDYIRSIREMLEPPIRAETLRSKELLLKEIPTMKLNAEFEKELLAVLDPGGPEPPPHEHKPPYTPPPIPKPPASPEPPTSIEAPAVAPSTMGPPIPAPSEPVEKPKPSPAQPFVWLTIAILALLLGFRLARPRQQK